MRFPIGDSDVVCIDWDERSLRAAEATVSRGGLKIRSAVQAPLPATDTPRDPAALGELIRQTLGEHRIRARRAILAVPRQDVVLNLMSLPQGTQDELAAMIHIQIAKELPFAKDQTVIDFAASPRNTGPNAEVWVAAVRNQVVDYYRQVISAAGLRPDRVGLRPYANMAALNALLEPSGRTLLVDVGPSMTEIDVIRDGRLAYSRAATVAIPPEEDELHAPLAMDSLLVEVNRTIGAYRSTDAEAKIDRIILAGSVGLDAATVNAFQTRFGVPTQIFTVPASLRWRGDNRSVAPFISVIGLALGTMADSLTYFNLLAPKEPESERRERIRRVPYKAAIVAALVALAVAAAYVPIHRKNREIADQNARIAQLNQDKAAREELMGFETALNGWREQNTPWLDHLKLLADVFPRTEKLYISKADFRESREIQLELQAVDEFQTGELARTINDQNGSARIGMRTASSDPKYRITDRMTVQMKLPAAKSPAGGTPAATQPATRTPAATRPASGNRRP